MTAPIIKVAANTPLAAYKRSVHMKMKNTSRLGMADKENIGANTPLAINMSQNAEKLNS